MASKFTGWGSSWGGSWGLITTVYGDPIVNPLQVALQGIFQPSPTQIAVQGLIGVVVTKITNYITTIRRRMIR